MPRVPQAGGNQEERRLLITQELDFSDNRRFHPGSHHGIVVIRPLRPGGEALFRRVIELFKRESVEHRAGCFVIATDSKIGIHGPGQFRRV